MVTATACRPLLSPGCIDCIAHTAAPAAHRVLPETVAIDANERPLLSDAQVARWRRRGYVALDGVLPEALIEAAVSAAAAVG